MIATVHELAIDIGEIPILFRTKSAELAGMLVGRYGEFVSPHATKTDIELDIRVVEPDHGVRDSGTGARDSANDEDYTARMPDPDADLSVRLESGRWVMERGDFRSEWDPETKRGWVRTAVNQYSIDGVLRILHSLILAREGGLLVHGASAVRNGRAFVFAGISGAGKTTISLLAPPDVTLLTDEISYIRNSGLGTRDSGKQERQVGVGNGELGVANGQPKSLVEATDLPTENRQSRIENSSPRVPNPESRVLEAFQTYGTPFAGELARIGAKTQAPLAELFLLQQGSENRIEPVTEGHAVRELMRHILFFAHDPELVELVFQTVCDFVKRVPVKRLVFKKDASVWELVA